jgi:subtilisin-like proprotein convertase family protein
MFSFRIFFRFLRKARSSFDRVFLTPAMTDSAYPDPAHQTLDDLDPENATTDRLIAMVRRHREGEEYPTAETLIGNLPDNPDPAPSVFYGSVAAHGTAVAGVAAATGGNFYGVAGVAPQARVAGRRVPLRDTYYPSELGDDFAMTDRFVDAIHFGGAAAIPIKNHSYGPDQRYAMRAAEQDAVRQTASAGMIHVYAAGNETFDTGTRASNLPEALLVAAVGADGRFADYSNYGASILVAGPSRANRDHLPGLFTTDMVGGYGYTNNAGQDQLASGSSWGDPDYTQGFGGTSGAAPVIAGALALAREVRPDLNLRWAKHLLVNTSRCVDAEYSTDRSDGGWRSNAAGCAFNPNYGFGLVDATALVCLAGNEHLQLSPLLTWDSPVLESPGAIPDHLATGLSIPLSFNPSPRQAVDTLEEVGISLRIDHAQRGQLEAVLISPSGTQRRLLHRYHSASDANAANGIGYTDDDGQRQPWTFWTYAFWGERPEGDWTLVLKDTARGTVGQVDTVQLHLRMGRLYSDHQVFQPCQPSFPSEGKLTPVTRP